MLSTNENVIQYAITGGGPAASYSIPFPYWASGEINAVLSFADSADEILDLTSDYTLSAPGASGTLTRVGTWTADAIQITIYRELDVTQETDYRNGDVFDADNLERSLDRLTAISQQLGEVASRQVSVPITDGSTSLELPSAAERANNFLGFDTNGDAITVLGSAPVPATQWAVDNLLDAENAADVRTAAGGTSVGQAMFTAATKGDQQALVAGSGLDAGTVIAYGIGADSVVLSGAGSLNAITSNGIYRTTGSLTDEPYPGAGAHILHMNQSSTYAVQLAFIQTGTSVANMYMREKVGPTPTWGAWYEIFTASSDGNGGQPPSAKSNKTSNSTIGWFDSVDCASGAQVTLPASGTFEWFVTTYGATYNSVKSGISAGGLMTGTASANLTMRYKRLS